MLPWPASWRKRQRPPVGSQRRPWHGRGSRAPRRGAEHFLLFFWEEVGGLAKDEENNLEGFPDFG